MTTPRDSFLQRVRRAAAQGNRAGAASDIPDRGHVGYQGAGPDPVARFCEELSALGGHPHVAPNRDAGTAKVIELVQKHAAKRVLLGRGPVLDTFGLSDRLRVIGVTVLPIDSLTPTSSRDSFFAADVGISSVDSLLSRPGEPRSLSLLPPVYIAVAKHSELIPDLFDLFHQLALNGASSPPQPILPSCLTLITGPSKTGDIELRLVTGVHGPGEIHVILVND
jgi:L-lactate utilization protein LutC